MFKNITYSRIETSDDAILAPLIKKIFEEFGIDKPGTVYTDPTTDHLSKVFENKDSIYWVAKENGNILGGCGIYPTQGLPKGYAELVKFYLSAGARGKGIGHNLMEKCFASAKEFGYSHLYLESFPTLSKAVSLYERNGFEMIDHPLGNSGHFACNIWMVKEL
ncbi:MAG: GNAT family N-acetyltransferase [Pseudopedobacter saltans]|uniref:GNAT family N-acetyltransferase n=1 Tax=Pseudopedobacter saltans TaxID=151895 RepID=A0A2W5EM29_9SPHI|nr:MAG: GNAT family N-acetyltransferase [Pseudopedobacter saltans]